MHDTLCSAQDPLPSISINYFARNLQYNVEKIETVSSSSQLLPPYHFLQENEYRKYAKYTII